MSKKCGCVYYVVPNWRDYNSYKYILDADYHQIAWEFLRRNSRYGKDYYRLINGDIELNKFYSKYDLLIQHDFSKYDPRNEECPGFEYFFPIFAHKKDRLTVDNLDEIVVKISSLVPIEHQLKEIEKRYKENFQENFPNLVGIKNDDKKDIVTYLRLLDARKTHGVTKSHVLFYMYLNMFEVVGEDYFPKKPEDIDNPPSGLGKSIYPMGMINRRFNKSWKTALKLRKNGYIKFVKSDNYFLENTKGIV